MNHVNFGFKNSNFQTVYMAYSLVIKEYSLNYLLYLIFNTHNVTFSFKPWLKFLCCSEMKVEFTIPILLDEVISLEIYGLIDRETNR